MDEIRTYDLYGCKMLDRKWDNSKRIVYVSSEYEMNDIFDYFKVLDLLDNELKISFNQIVCIKFKRHDKEYYLSHSSDSNVFCMTILYNV